MEKKKFDTSCTSPLVMIKDGFNLSGKRKYKMLGKANDLDFNDPDRIIVPCGNCINCRLAHSRRWADRLMIESMSHEQSWFVTLTYNDFWIPTSYYTDLNTGELLPAYSLWKRDFQLFMKRLRRDLDYPIRFYACGEYGGKTFRPHYHAILFGLKLDEKDLYNERKGKSGFSLWQSKIIEEAWSKEECGRKWPIGHVMVAPVNWQTCAYVSRYVTKKLKGEESHRYSDFNIEPPFSLMSRRPGIAKEFYENAPEFVRDHRSMFVPTDKGSKKVGMPKYYDRFLELDFPDEFEYIKDKRSTLAKANMRNRPNTDLDFFEYNELRSSSSEKVLKKLIREEV